MGRKPRPPELHHAVRARRREDHSIADYLPLLLVLAVLIIIYAPLREAQFLQWDDFKTIAANPDLNPPTAKSVLRYWDPRRPYMDLYVPVTYTAWAVVASVSAPVPAAQPKAAAPGRPAPRARLDPAAFHIASLAVHAIATLLAFLVLCRLLAAHEVPATSAAWAAGVGAGLFSLHPLQVESVAWASGLKDLLAAAFTLTALWLFLMFAEARLDPDAASAAGRPAAATAAVRLGPIPVFALATFAFVLAMLSKPSAVMTPLLAACLALSLPAPTARPARAARGASSGDTAPRSSVLARLAGLRPVLGPLGLWILLAIPVMLIARRAQPAASGFDSPPWARPLVALDALAFYAAKLVAPVRLAMDYGRSPDWLASTPSIRWTWIVPVAIGAAVFLLRKRAPWLVPAALFPVAALFTVLGLVRFDFQSKSTVADHYVYVALLGPALALAFLLSREALGRIGLIGVVVLAPFASLSRAQVPVWHDTESLFTHTLAINPRSVSAHINLGHILYAQGHTEDAMRHDEEALTTRPDEPEAHNNLGNALLRLKRPREAAEHFRAALAVQPDSASSHFNLGIALSDLGDVAGATREYQETLRLAPSHAAALTNLAEIALNAGDFDEAAAGYRRALAIDPSLGAARRGLAHALAGQRGAGGAGASAGETHDAVTPDPASGD